MEFRAFIAMAFVAPLVFVLSTAVSAHDYVVKDGTSIEASLTGKPGDAAKGRKLAISRKKGNCLACHVMPIPEQPYHGKIGTDLNGAGSRYTEGELRLRIVNSKVLNRDTIMPAFHKWKGLHRVLKKFRGKTILTAEDVEDVIAYVMTLK